MAETLAALFLAHVLADYVFQTTYMVEEKHRPEVLFLHALIVLACAMATTGHLASPMIYALALIHILIDIVKVKAFSDAFLPHLGDQIAHLITLAALAALAPDLFATGLYAESADWLPRAMLLTAGAIYATRAGGFAVGKLMAPYGGELTRDSLPGGGAVIGLLERGLIYLFMLAGQGSGIGFLIAAKSVLRFETIREGDDDSRKMAEYVIIGTLASFGWAIAVSLGVTLTMTALPPLEIGLPTP